MMVKRAIMEYHGRVENIRLFNTDPAVFWREERERDRAEALKRKEMAKKAAAAAAAGEEMHPEDIIEDDKPAAAKKESEGYITYDDPNMTLYQIFGEYGVAKKSDWEVREDDNDEEKEAKKQNKEKCEKTLYYDFTPYNSKDPVLRSFMGRVKGEDLGMTKNADKGGDKSTI